jgi:hypothetical protein
MSQFVAISREGFRGFPGARNSSVQHGRDKGESPSRKGRTPKAVPWVLRRTDSTAIAALRNRYRSQSGGAVSRAARCVSSIRVAHTGRRTCAQFARNSPHGAPNWGHADKKPRFLVVRRAESRRTAAASSTPPGTAWPPTSPAAPLRISTPAALRSAEQRPNRHAGIAAVRQCTSLPSSPFRTCIDPSRSARARRNSLQSSMAISFLNDRNSPQ